MAYEAWKSIIALIGIITFGGIFAWKMYRMLWVNLRRAQPEERLGNWGRRIVDTIQYVLGQWRLFRVLIPGTSHFFIFWGFLILSLTILQAILEGLLAFTNPNFVLPFFGEFGPLALLQDLFTVFVAIAVIAALYTRVVINPERYKGSHKSQGVMVLIFILIIMSSLVVMNGARIQQGEDPLQAWRPVSSFVGNLFAGLDAEDQFTVGEVAYWIHLTVVLIFLTELPGGKHFHVVTALPSVFLRNLDPHGKLPDALDFEGSVGVSRVEQFRWRQMLDFYTCTECGRCQDVCPAYASGLELSPKLLMMGLRDHLTESGDAFRTGKPDDSIRELVGEVIKEDVIWACTTCYACDQECPLFIEHVTPIVEMRRHLVFEGNMGEMLQETLDNLGRYGNSFGQSERARAKWTRTFDGGIRDARKEAVKYLWFLGDYASYSSSLAQITQKTAEVFQHVGLDFGILYEGERNAGNDVRRTGEEGLFEMLVEENERALSRSTHEVIVTTDPHSYNTLKNEYPKNGGDCEVIHSSELLDRLIASGDLRLGSKLNYKVTYHDPCYLGRYNDVYDEPRRVIEATGCILIEMPRSRDRALCCGAGGGRIWMEEQEVKERPSEARIREAVELRDVEVFVVACPKDVTMYQDAVKTAGYEDRIVVKELIELVHEAM